MWRIMGWLIAIIIISTVLLSSHSFLTKLLFLESRGCSATAASYGLRGVKRRTSEQGGGGGSSRVWIGSGWRRVMQDRDMGEDLMGGKGRGKPRGEWRGDGEDPGGVGNWENLRSKSKAIVGGVERRRERARISRLEYFVSPFFFFFFVCSRAEEVSVRELDGYVGTGPLLC
jgi:hypothetical protein